MNKRIISQVSSAQSNPNLGNLFQKSTKMSTEPETKSAVLPESAVKEEQQTQQRQTAAPINTNTNNNSPSSTSRSHRDRSPPAIKKSDKPPTKFVKSAVMDRLYNSTSPRSAGNNEGDNNELHQVPSTARSISPPGSATGGGRYSPAMAQREYLTELRLRQSSQLTSVASYLESHAREPSGALCGKNLGGWTYGPSYSRTVESLDPEAETYPPSASARRTVVLSSARTLPYQQENQIRQYLAHHHAPTGSHSARTRGTSQYNGSRVSTARSTVGGGIDSSRPGTAASHHSMTSARSISSFASNSNLSSPSSVATAATSLYNVVLEAPFNIRPKSAKFEISNSSSTGRQQGQSYAPGGSGGGTASARPLSSEYYYPTRRKKVQNDELLSKADLAVKKHKEKQRKLELQKEKMKNAAPMEFRWQL